MPNDQHALALVAYTTPCRSLATLYSAIDSLLLSLSEYARLPPTSAMLLPADVPQHWQRASVSHSVDFSSQSPFSRHAPSMPDARMNIHLGDSDTYGDLSDYETWTLSIRQLDGYTTLRKTDPRWILDMNTRLFRDSQAGIFLCKQFFTCLDSLNGSRWGHAEVCDNRIAGTGSRFYNDLAREALDDPPHRQLDHMLWWHPDTDRVNRVRGVYWGMYFGRDLLKRFDPDGSMKRAFLDFDAFKTGKQPQQWHDLSGGGAFLCMSDDPTDIITGSSETPSGWCIQNMVWMHQRLREKDMLV